MRHANYEILPDDNSYYGEIPECGVWSNEATNEECRAELRSIIEDWILLHMRDGAEFRALISTN